MSERQRRSRWGAFWDPEAEALVLTLASTILAGAGIAMIMMGALPSPPPALDSPDVVAVGDTVPGPGPGSSTSTSPSTKAKKHTQPSRPAVSPKASKKASPAKQAKDAPLTRSVPLTLNIPSIGVHTAVMQLGLKSDGTVALPPLKGDAPAGWYKYLATPGEAGPAVILGHVDSAKDGPAVFYRLRNLRPGDRISVGRADGSTASFTVRSTAKYPKDEFPTKAVYGPVSTPELHLVTCGGSFDSVRHRYRDNIVVYATLTSSTRAKHPPAT